jgi:hypothetical protein
MSRNICFCILSKKSTLFPTVIDVKLFMVHSVAIRIKSIKIKNDLLREQGISGSFHSNFNRTRNYWTLPFDDKKKLKKTVTHSEQIPYKRVVKNIFWHVFHVFLVRIVFFRVQRHFTPKISAKFQ